MKKPFLKKLGNVFKRIGLGIIETPTKPLLGALDGVKNVVLDNINSKDNGEGNIDWVRILGAVVSVVLILLTAFGKIDKELFNYLIEFATELSE